MHERESGRSRAAHASGAAKKSQRFLWPLLAIALGACAGRVGTSNDSGSGGDVPRAPDGAVLPSDAVTVLPDGLVVGPDGEALDGDEFDADEPDATLLPDGFVVRPDAAMADVPRDIVRADATLRDVPVIDRDVTFREDACPPVTGPAVRMYDCDPLATRSGCGPGEGCYTTIEYPPMPCAREIYRAICIPAGSTPVNSPCGSGDECVPGSACFVTGAGNRCLRLCRTDGTEPSCPRGQVCEPTDSPDIGACD